jgi:hypothetical protein
VRIMCSAVRSVPSAALLHTLSQIRLNRMQPLLIRLLRISNPVSGEDSMFGHRSNSSDYGSLLQACCAH